MIEPDNPARRTVWFTPSETGKITLQIRRFGMASSPELPVEDSSIGVIVAGCVTLDVTAGQRLKASLTMATPYDGPIEIAAMTPHDEEAVDAN